MLFLRTELFALRSERPSSTIFLGERATAPMSPAARAEADELLRVAGQVVGGPSLFADWCIADADLALALQRLIVNGDAVPEPLRRYADAVWARPSVRSFAEHP